MTTARPNTDDFLNIFLNDIPLMDTRAPVEFEKGSFPTAVNHPILDDRQREIIGTCYKNEGNAAATALGYKMFEGELKAERQATWKGFAEQHPNGYLFCFRGGQRSYITQSWLQEVGIDYPLIKGGYKAMRRFLIDELEACIAKIPFVILSGRTGTGKTRVIHDLPYTLDLEGLANHRGSSFGRRVGGQPSQIDFENSLAIAMIKHRHNHPCVPLLLEDESKLIGRCALPDSMKAKMQCSPLILLEASLQQRVEIVRQEYINDNLAEFEAAYGSQDGFEKFAASLQDCFYRIRRRLGGERYQSLMTVLNDALMLQKNSGDISGHSVWIEQMLSDYYDPMYDYQLTLKQAPILVKGERAAISDFFTGYVQNGEQ